MVKRSILLFALILTSNLISAQTSLVDSFMFGGLMRNYRVYVPAIYSNTSAVPLVLNLHGYTSNAFQQEFYTNFKTIADTANFILVHPNGTFDLNGDQYWNNFDVSNVDDVGFLSALIDSLSNQFAIDPNRIYSTGMSNGGFMSYDLACFLNNRIAAIASVTGAMIFSHIASCNPSHPTPVMQIHGTADPTVSYTGSASFAPIEDLVDYWVNFNNCDTPAIFTALPDISTADGCTAEHYVYSGGNNNASVEFYKINGGGHTWPGSPITIGVTNQDFSATKEIWRFFRQYRLNDLVGINQEPTETIERIFPNPANQQVMIPSTNQGFKIFDLYGRCWYSVNGKSEQHLLDISSLVEGVYWVSIGEYNQRLVVVKD
ncbi:MAG: T9SS type A sorting domain-containing protein [Bacteroidia bacterium]|nr:T9SS type A sorting domain-containing protein [Bacteroidia bacterium]